MEQIRRLCHCEEAVFADTAIPNMELSLKLLLRFAYHNEDISRLF